MAMAVKMKDFAKTAVKPIRGPIKLPTSYPGERIKPAGGGGGGGKISWNVQKGRKEL